MNSKNIDKNIRMYLMRQRLFYSLLFIIFLLVLGLFIASTTYLNTGEIVNGKVLNTYVSPSNRQMRPGESTVLARVFINDSEEADVRIPARYLPKVGDNFVFQIHQSFFFKRIKYVPQKKL